MVVQSVTVAGLAFRRRRPIEDHNVPVYFPLKVMALAAGHILMCTLQVEFGASVMVEVRRLPSKGIMATGTIRDISASNELARVGIFVATRTLLRSSPKIDIFQGSLQGGRTMTIGTSNATMRADEWEFCRRMVEAIEFLPGIDCVARLATHGTAVGAASLHPVTEFATVRILMAGGARTILELIFHWSKRGSGNFHVTIHAGHGQVRSR